MGDGFCLKEEREVRKRGGGWGDEGKRGGGKWDGNERDEWKKGGGERKNGRMRGGKSPFPHPPLSLPPFPSSRFKPVSDSILRLLVPW